MLLGLASPDSKPICHSCSFDIANTFQKCLFTKQTKQSLLFFKTLAKHIWKVRRKRTTWTACLWNYSQTFAFLKFWNDFRTKLAPAELLKLSWSISSQEKSYHGTREFPIKFSPTPLDVCQTQMVPHEQPTAPKPTAGTSYDWMFIVPTPNGCTAEQTLTQNITLRRTQMSCKEQNQRNLHTLASPDVTTTEMPASMWHILTSSCTLTALQSLICANCSHWKNVPGVHSFETCMKSY